MSISRESRCCGSVNVGLWNVLWMGVCFFGLFSCFNPVQSLQSSTAPAGYGFIGIGVLYGAFSLATLVSSQITRLLGQKTAILLGALCYALYIVVLLLLGLTHLPPGPLYQLLYYGASVIIGLGAALLWTAQGSIVTVMASVETRGLYNGVFWGTFMCNYLAGGLITEFILGTDALQPSKSDQDIVRLYIIFTTLAVASALGLFFLRMTPALRRQKHVRLNLLETVSLMVDKRFLCLWPAIMYSGFSSAFFNVLYTSYMGRKWVGLNLIVFGGCEVLGSIVGGQLSDRIGRTPVFLFSCLCTMIGVCLAALSTPGLLSGPDLWYYFAAYAFLGLGDSGFNTQVQAVLGHFYPDHSQPAFAGYRFLLSVCAMIGSLAGFWLDPHSILIPAIVLWSVLLVALVGWIVLDWWVQSVSDDGPKYGARYAKAVNREDTDSEQN